MVIKDYSIQLLSYLKDKINVYDDKGTPTERLLKMAIVDFDCRMENIECLNTMTTLFNSIPKSYFADPNTQSNPYFYIFKPIYFLLLNINHLFHNYSSKSIAKSPSTCLQISHRKYLQPYRLVRFGQFVYEDKQLGREKLCHRCTC